MTWFLFRDKLDQGIGKPKLGISVFAFGSNPGVPDKRIICAEDKCECIKQENFFCHAAKVNNSGFNTQQVKTQ